MTGYIWDKSVWSGDDIKWTKDGIITLMEAAGEPIYIHNSYQSNIEDLLEKFTVGTEKRKK